MTDRIPLDAMTSDALDDLYERIATLEHVAASNKRHVRTIVPELERAEAERDRATEAARRALEQRQEMAAERYAWQERGDRAEHALARVRDTAEHFLHEYESGPDPCAAAVLAALDEQPATRRTT